MVNKVKLGPQSLGFLLKQSATASKGYDSFRLEGPTFLPEIVPYPTWELFVEVRDWALKPEGGVSCFSLVLSRRSSASRADGSPGPSNVSCDVLTSVSRFDHLWVLSSLSRYWKAYPLQNRQVCCFLLAKLDKRNSSYFLIGNKEWLRITAHELCFHWNLFLFLKDDRILRKSLHLECAAWHFHKKWPVGQKNHLFTALIFVHCSFCQQGNLCFFWPIGP